MNDIQNLQLISSFHIFLIDFKELTNWTYSIQVNVSYLISHFQLFFQ